MQPFRLSGGPFGAPDEPDLLHRQSRDQDLVQHPVLFIHQFAGTLGDGLQCLLGRESVRARLGGTQLQFLFQAGNADLEKLIQIGAGDAEKAQPFQQGHTLVLGLFQNPPIELQQAQFPVDVELRALQVDLGGIVHGSAGG